MSEATESPERVLAETGSVHTFLIADLRGYTHYTLQHGDEAAAALARRFARLASDVAAAHGGEMVEVRGDEALAVFASARQALRAALALRAGRLADEDEPLALPIGAGIDSGEAIPVDGGYRGAALNLAARLCSLAGPGEILASDTVMKLARRLEGVRYQERGTAELKGFAEPVAVVQILWESETAAAGPAFDAGTAGAVAEQQLPIGGYLGSLPADPLAGRQDELKRVMAHAGEVIAGEGRLVMLSGEPGVGKTRLAQEVTLQLRRDGFLIAAGRCYEPEQSVPYYPFLDALATLFSLAPRHLQREAPRRWPYLGALLPEQMGVPEVAGGQGRDEQIRLFRAVNGFLSTLAGEAPLALLLDDLHWADEASLRLLTHLARHTRDSRLLLCGTYRDVEVSRQHPLEEALIDLGREGLVDRVPVRRLDQPDTTTLIGQVLGQAEVSGDFARLVQERTEGNPFFIQQVLRVLVERGDVYREAGRWERKEIWEIEVPESVRAVIGRRLARLAEPTQEVLREASVLGTRFDFDELQAASGRGEAEIEGALGEASAAGLVQHETGDVYTFDHALTQQALSSELTPRRRRRLHLAVGEALASLPEERQRQRIAELAWHFQQADDPERALPYSLRAGDQAEAVFAHGDAERQYRIVLDLAAEIGDSGAEREALEKLGSVLRTTARLDEAIEVLERAASLAHAAGDLEAELRIAALLGWSHATRVTPGEGIKHLRETLASASVRPPSSGLAVAYVALAQLCFVTGQYAEQLEAAERAGAIAREVDDMRTLVQAAGRRAVALDMLGRGDEARDLLEKIVPLAEKTGDLDTLCRSLNNLADKYLGDTDLVRAQEAYERGLAAAVRTGDPDQISFMKAKCSVPVMVRGELHEALHGAQEALEMVQSSPAMWSALAIHNVIAGVYIMLGRLDEAKTHLAEATAVAARAGDFQFQLVADLGLGWCDVMLGNGRAAVDRLAPLVERQTAQSVSGAELAMLAEAYLLTGDLAQVEATLEQGVTGEGHLVPSAPFSLQRVRGMLRARQGRTAEAAEEFEAAIADARTLPNPHSEASALYEYGRMLAAEGKPDAARAHLQQAQAIFRRIDSWLMLERTEQALAELPAPEGN